MHLTRPSDTEVPLFEGLSKAERRSLPRLMTRVRIDAGTVLAQQDSSTREFMIIIEGEASRTGKKMGLDWTHKTF